MDFFETPEEVGKQLDEARARLKDFEENADSAVLLGRLRNAAPFHPALLARKLFLTLAILALLGAVALGALPFAMEELPPQVVTLELALGMPLPVVCGLLAACLGVAYFGASQAALSFARECPLAPSEQKEHERLVNEVKRLSSQKAIMDRVRGTPMGARPRSATPVPIGLGRAGSPVGAPSRPGSMSSVPRFTPGPAERSYSPPMPSAPNHEEDSETPTPPKRTATPPPVSRGAAPAQSAPGPLARAKASSAAAPPAKAAPARKSLVDEDKFANGPFKVPEDDLVVTANSELLAEVPDAEGYDDEDEMVTHNGPAPTPLAARPLTPSPSIAPASTAVAGVGFEQRYATHFPKWGRIDEPWLEDAIQKSEILATGFPVQAHLEFSGEPNLPFTLILERATPAMAVRAMVSYVEFLASIATPPRARILMRSVPHLDRSFHRNVEAALEPYFGEKAQVAREADRIEIKFLEWDTAWKDYPYLPIEPA